MKIINNDVGSVMNRITTQAVGAFMAFFAIMNPIANTAVFAGLAGNRPRNQQIQIACKALIITFAIVAIFAVLG